MANEKRLIDANALRQTMESNLYWGLDSDGAILDTIDEAPTVDAVELPCHCCDCYYLLNSKNSFGLYFFCGHQNGLKNLTNTEKNFCPYGKRRYDNERKAD